MDLDASANTITFNVSSINDSPAGTDKTIGINEEGSYTFAATDFGFSDPNDTPANTLLAVKITTLPAAGTLKLDNVDVTAGQSIVAADITKLVYTPAANANGTGYATFTFQVQDDGGTAIGGVDLDASANTITFNVSSTQPDNPFIPPRAPTTGDVVLSPESDVLRVSSKRAFGTGSFFTGAGDDNFTIRSRFAKRSVYVDAGEGNDVVVTRSGSDTIRGGAGNDYLKASTSAGRRRRPEVDRIEGGEGADTFVLAASSRKSLYLDIKGRGASSYALITDFESQDKLQLAGRRRRSYSISRDFVPEGLEGTTGFALFDGADMLAYVIADPAVVASVDLDDSDTFAYVGRVRR